MTSVQIEISGVEKIVRDLERYPQKAAQVYGNAVQQAGSVYRDYTKALPAVSASRTGYGAKGMPVDTGRLRGSIQKKKLQALAVGIGPTVKYGKFVHGGVDSRSVPARPFMEWSLELGAQKMIDAIFIRASSLLP